MYIGLMAQIIFTFSVLVMLSAPAYADSVCVGQYKFTNSKGGLSQWKPTKAPLGHTRTARGCLENCNLDRHRRLERLKSRFEKLEYSCLYNGKSISKTSQILR